MKVAELIERVNAVKYWSLYSLEKDLEFSLEIVAHGLNVDKQKWYEISTTVYRCEDGFVAVRGISQLYGEWTDCIDCLYRCVAKELEAFQ